MSLNATLSRVQNISDPIPEPLRGSQIYVRYRAGVTDWYQTIQDALDTFSKVVIGTDPSEVFVISQPIYPNQYQNLVINGTLKIQDGVTVNVTSDVAPTDTTVDVDDVSDLAVGQWLAVTDDDQVVLYATDRGWCGRITDITGLTVTLDNQCPLTIEVSDNARASLCQNCILVLNSNVTISGIGVIDNNASAQDQIHPVYGIGEAEQQRAGCCVTLWEADDFRIDGVSCINGLLHCIALTGETAVGDCVNVWVSNLVAQNGHDKCILVRHVDHCHIDNVIADGANYEDGITFYTFNRYAFVTNVSCINNNRAGFFWNAESIYLTASNITTYGNTYRGIYVTAAYANFFNCICIGDWVSIYNPAPLLYDPHDIQFSNLQIINTTYDQCLLLWGDVNRVIITNLIIEGCDTSGGLDAAITSKAVGGDDPQEVLIAHGGVYNHTGVTTDISVGSDVTFANFDT